MKKSANTQKMILASVVALLLSFFIVIFYIVPRISNLKSLSTEVKAKEAELEIGLEEVQALRSAVQLIKTAKADMATLGIAMPDQDKAEEALAQLGSNAAKSSLEIKSVSIGAGDKGSVSISISTSGGFDQTMTFIDNLEKNLRPIKIQNYTLSSVESASAIDSSFTLLFPFLSSTSEQNAEGEAVEGTAAGEAASSPVAGEKV